MVKISVDLLSSDESLISEELLLSVVSGCRKAFLKLGRIGDTIEVFRITFLYFDDNLVPGPLFRICFHDPLGKECACSFDYRFIGSKTPVPSSAEIADAIRAYILAPILEHLGRCKKTIKIAQSELDELMPEK